MTHALPLMPLEPLDCFPTLSTLWPLVMVGEPLPTLSLGQPLGINRLLHRFLARLQREWFPLAPTTEATTWRYTVPIARQPASSLLDTYQPVVDLQAYVGESDPLLLVTYLTERDSLPGPLAALPLLLRWLGNGTGNPFLDEPSATSAKQRQPPFRWDPQTLFALRLAWRSAKSLIAAARTLCDHLAAHPGAREETQRLLQRLRMREQVSDEYGYQRAA